LDVGLHLRQLRSIAENRPVPIFQDGTDIYSTVLLHDGYLGILAQFCDPVTIQVSSKIENERVLIERTLGEAVATSLRNKINDPWKIEEVSRTVFEVSHPIALDGYWEIKVFKGFRYQPLVLESGQAGLVIDPKYKFHSSHHLRDLIKQSGMEYSAYFERNLEDEEGIVRLVDTCPVDECSEKRDPFSICKLAGTGKTVVYQSYNDSSPSSIEPDLMEYHLKERICPKSPLLRKALDNLPPVVLVEINQRTYWYPVERLRLLPTFARLQEDDRNMLMDKVRPFPQDRFSLTEYFGSRLSDIRIEGISTLYSKGFRSNSIPIPTYEFTFPELMVGGNNRTRFPHRDIQKHGPADNQVWKDKTLDLFVLYNEEDEEDAKLFVDTISGTKKNPVIPSINNFLKISIETIHLEKIRNINSIDMFTKIKEICNSSQTTCVLLLHSGQSGNSFRKLETLLIENNIPKQGVNIDEFKKQYAERMRGYFRNIYLGVYAKIGGHAWLLTEVENPSVVYVGLSSKISGNEYHCTLSTFTNNGRFIEGRYLKINKDEAVNKLRSEIEELTKNYPKTIILILGKDFVLGYERGQEILSKMSTQISALEITTSPIRIYKYHGQKIFPPDAGTAVELRPGTIALVSSRMPFGTPDPIILEIVHGRSQDLREELESIFKLTQCYTGYEKFSVKLPVPLHAANRAMKKALALDLPSFSFDKAWYV